MKFEYNTHMSYEERKKFVAEDICNVYKDISYDIALKVGSLAVGIDDKATNDEKFDRYYLIMKFIGRTHPDFHAAFNDAYELYTKGLSNKNNNIMQKIIEYITGERAYFPDLL